MELHEEYEAVRREIVVAADRDRAWELVGDPRGLERWLADAVELDEIAPGAEGEVRIEGDERRVVVEEVEPGRRVTLRWWSADGAEDDATVVDLTLDDAPGGVRITVVELPVRVLAVASTGIAVTAPRGPQMAMAA